MQDPCDLRRTLMHENVTTAFFSVLVSSGQRRIYVATRTARAAGRRWHRRRNRRAPGGVQPWWLSGLDYYRYHRRLHRHMARGAAWPAADFDDQYQRPSLPAG